MKIFIKVRANAGNDKVDLPQVYVKQLAREGKANEAVIKLLAKHFNVSKSAIKIVSGLKSKNKIVEIK